MLVSLYLRDFSSHDKDEVFITVLIVALPYIQLDDSFDFL